MKRISSFAFVALAFFADYTYSYTHMVPQIKCLGLQISYKNPEYGGSKKVFYITKHNESYNNIQLHWELPKDLPADFTVDVQVHVTDNTFEGGKLISENSIPVCEESRNRELLPSIFVVDKALLGTGKPCIPKNIYDVKDVGNFRFEVLVPDVKDIGEYYRIDYVLRLKYAVVDILTTYNQWGYA